MGRLAMLLMLTLSTTSAASADAFGWSGAGVQLGCGAPEALQGTMMFGAHVELEQTAGRVHLLPGLVYWREGGWRNINPNLDASYHFLPDRKVTPYLGAGVGLHVLSQPEASGTDVGANLFGGVRIPGSSSHYFVEGRYVLSAMYQLSVMGGVTFH